MARSGVKHWKVTRIVELGATRESVWAVVGGFYTIHTWHPDITRVGVPRDQTITRELRRELEFPGQAPTMEELVLMDNDDCRYSYKWHSGAWGERVKNYRAALRVFAGDGDDSSIVQWSSEFDYSRDAVSEFYESGFRSLLALFPMRTRG
jgi:hypothetical protein